MVDHSPLFRALGYKPAAPQPVKKVDLPPIPAGIGIVENLKPQVGRLIVGKGLSDVPPVGFKINMENPFDFSSVRPKGAPISRVMTTIKPDGMVQVIDGFVGGYPFTGLVSRDHKDPRNAVTAEFRAKMQEHMRQVAEWVESPEYKAAVENLHQPRFNILDTVTDAKRFGFSRAEIKDMVWPWLYSSNQQRLSWPAWEIDQTTQDDIELVEAFVNLEMNGANSAAKSDWRTQALISKYPSNPCAEIDLPELSSRPSAEYWPPVHPEYTRMEGDIEE